MKILSLFKKEEDFLKSVKTAKQKLQKDKEKNQKKMSDIFNNPSPYTESKPCGIRSIIPNHKRKSVPYDNRNRADKGGHEDRK